MGACTPVKVVGHRQEPSSVAILFLDTGSFTEPGAHGLCYTVGPLGLRSACLPLPSTGVTGSHHHTWL